jgi:two-component system sensor histidine kinase PilS (NtrC family)
MLTSNAAPEARYDTATAGPGQFAPPWKVLRYLNLYRLVIASLLLVIGFWDKLASPLGTHYPMLYFTTSVSYLSFSLVSIFFMDWRRPPFTIQVYTHILVDITAITVLIHAGGGLKSGLGVLLVVAIAGGSLLMAGRMAILFAAIATLSVLGEQVYSQISDSNTGTNFTHAGLLGATFFATATLAYILAKRVRESEALAAQRGVDLANLEQLTSYIVERMQTGIVVVDNVGRVRLVNDSARHLLGLEGGGENPIAQRLPPALIRQLKEWHDASTYEPYALQPTKTSPDIMPRFARLGVDKDSGTLIFLEDMTAMAQHAQQLKLASLGRLTASIAHEIRNPLSAISYAGQLLAESPHTDTSDQRLTQIIRDQSRRVNTIVENVLQLSRRKRTQPEEIDLWQWLAGFISEFCRTQSLDESRLEVNITPQDLMVRIDPDQLHQILWNLCHNGMRYTEHRVGKPALELRGGIAPGGQTPFLDVIDFGPGIDEAVAEHIFEPFFTTAQKGTGLGLYIARELCEANQARLNYLRTPGGGSCFRISFADPRRRQVA